MLTSVTPQSFTSFLRQYQCYSFVSYNVIHFDLETALFFFMGRRYVGNMGCFKSHDSIINSLLVMNIYLLNHDLNNVRENGTAF